MQNHPFLYTIIFDVFRIVFEQIYYDSLFLFLFLSRWFSLWLKPHIYKNTRTHIFTMINTFFFFFFWLCVWILLKIFFLAEKPMAWIWIQHWPMLLPDHRHGHWMIYQLKAICKCCHNQGLQHKPSSRNPC